MNSSFEESEMQSLTIKISEQLAYNRPKQGLSFHL